MNHVFKTLTGLLLGATAIAGCQREPMEEPNPNFDPETNEVNAAFVFSVSTGSTSSATKMSATSVQKSTNFLGIDNAKLFLYADGENPAFVKSTDGSKFKQMYELGPVLTPGYLNAANNASSSSNRILQLSLPIGADAALFYGKATPGTIPSGKTQAQLHGSIDFTHINQDPAQTYFAVSRRIGSENDVKAYDATGRLMIFAINKILSVSLPAAASYGGYANLDPISWKQLGHQWEINHEAEGGNPYGRTGDVVAQSELATSLGKAYATFTHIKRDNTQSSELLKLVEFRAGSSAAVQAMMVDLAGILEKTGDLEQTTPTSKDEMNVVRLANAILDTMHDFFTTSWSYKDISVIKGTFVGTDEGKMTETQWNYGTGSSADNSTGFYGATSLNNYPSAFHIPVGAAQLTFDYEDGKDVFSYTHPNKALVTPGREFEPRKYVYAPELVYYANSPIWVTAKTDLSNSDFPNGTTEWKKNNTVDGKWKAGSWTLTQIGSTTRGVAIRDNINYGVALMETNVAWSAGAISAGSIEDNTSTMTGGAENNRSIDLDDADFELKGILIGGVHPRYDWRFLPMNHGDNSLGNFDGVIYDDEIVSSSVPTTAPTYTLVYDNYDWNQADDQAQNNVYIALEFINHGEDFWGRDNIIPKEGVFYLGARLDISDTQAANSLTWPDDHQIPPIYETGDHKGESKKIPRIFIQDFLTKATFRIGVNSLKSAYYSVPDLASSQMSFGLSVDLNWQSGYEYDLVFGDPDPVSNP